MSRDALIVGINTYSYLQPLKAPAADAEAIAQRLEQDGDFNKIVRLPESIDQSTGTNRAIVGASLPVSQGQLEQALEQLFLPGSSQGADTALFYFSGHGLPDQKGYDKGYLATSETDPNHPRSASLSLQWLQWLLSESAVRQQIVWLDCCHSGGLLINVEAANPGHGEQRNRCFIASSRDFESSWQDLNSPYSVLTQALLAGLDPSRLPGRWIDSFALVDYVNQALRGELQKPLCTNFGDAINLTRTWQVEADTPAETQADLGICPYKGLEFFDWLGDDPKYFYGRESLTNQLLDTVRTTNFMALVGASGSGKSSVLRSGLLHQLSMGRRIAGSDQWRIRITRPDRTPLKNLALAFVEAEASNLDRAEQLDKAERLLEQGAEGLRRLVDADPAPRVILVVDQFEEVFTRCEDPAEREQFFATLIGAIAVTDNKLCLIIAMRADFVGKCLEQEYSGLANWVQQQMVPVLPMTAEELRAAICKPATQVGLEVEPTLVHEILHDIAGAPGSLPLLQYSLKQLWQQRLGNQLTLTAYQQLGGIHGSLNQRATQLYQTFDEAEQATVRHIFQQLTQLGEGTEDTRRRVFLESLIAPPLHPTDRVQKVINALSAPDHRLLVTSEVVGKGPDQQRMAIVDVAHEALIRHWTPLRQWIENNRDLLRQQRRIETGAVTWQEQGKAKGYLLQGLPLIEALRFQKQHSDVFPLSDPARMFIQKSVQQRRWNRLKTASLLIFPAMALVGVIDYNLRENYANANRIRMERGAEYEQRVAIEILVGGCDAILGDDLPANYLTERFFGYCRRLLNAPLSGADLKSAYLKHVNFSHADLTSANLSSANLSQTDLSYADLRGADLSGANLTGANLTGANLTGANLSYANLSDANLDKTNLSASILLRTNLRDARSLTSEQLLGQEPPLFCAAILPTAVASSLVNLNRDCDQITRTSQQGYRSQRDSAETLIDESKQTSRTSKQQPSASTPIAVLEQISTTPSAPPPAPSRPQEPGNAMPGRSMPPPAPTQPQGTQPNLPPAQSSGPEPRQPAPSAPPPAPARPQEPSKVRPLPSSSRQSSGPEPRRSAPEPSQAPDQPPTIPALPAVPDRPPAPLPDSAPLHVVPPPPPPAPLAPHGAQPR